MFNPDCPADGTIPPASLLQYVTMITVPQAEGLIAQNVPTLCTERVAVACARGRILRETIVAERDQPPFDRAMMDGIAVAADDRDGRYQVVGEAPAGAPAGRLGRAGVCVEIMTGAPMPDGGDCVVPVEQIERAGDTVTLKEDALLQSGRFVHPRASDHSAGARLLGPGTRLGASEIAVVVSAGMPAIAVSRLPRVAICATGDELVDVDAAVEPHQIRRSNDYALAAMLEDWGYSDCRRLHVGDGVREQTRVVGEALAQDDVLVLTGGVSMGRHDHVSEVLHALDVELIFHRVSQKPGKPMWFGVGPGGQPVFALPGNPVSALVSLRRYVLPALDIMSAKDGETRRSRAALAEDVHFAPALTCFLPATCAVDDSGRLMATPRPTNTSGDFSALAGTDGFVELEPGKVDFAAGHSAPWFAW